MIPRIAAILAEFLYYGLMEFMNLPLDWKQTRPRVSVS